MDCHLEPKLDLEHSFQTAVIKKKKEEEEELGYFFPPVHLYLEALEQARYKGELRLQTAANLIDFDLLQNSH